MVIAIIIIAHTELSNPSAKPFSNNVAGPVFAVLLRLITGECSGWVKYEVSLLNDIASAMPIAVTQKTLKS